MAGPTAWFIDGQELGVGPHDIDVAVFRYDRAVCTFEQALYRND